MSVETPRYFVMWTCKNRCNGHLWTPFKDHAQMRAREYRAKSWVQEASVRVEIRDKHNKATGELEPAIKEEREG